MKGQEAFNRLPITKSKGFCQPRCYEWFPPKLGTYSNRPSSLLPCLGWVLENADALVETALDISVLLESQGTAMAFIITDSH